MPISQKDWDAFLASIRWQMRAFSPRQDFLAKNIIMRDSLRDAVASMAIFFDVTGSMGEIPQQFVDGSLLTLINEIENRGSIPNPEIMFGGVGDVECDSYPLQVTNFNTGIKAAKELRQLYIEGGGGSNTSESYPAAWLFAARKTNPMSLEFGQKGILFTMGDELYPQVISAAHMEQHLGISNTRAERSLRQNTLALRQDTLSTALTTRLAETSSALTTFFSGNSAPSSITTFTPAASSLTRRRPISDPLTTALCAHTSRPYKVHEARAFNSDAVRSADISTQDILAEAQQKYEVFHLVLKADQYPTTFKAWKNLLGDKAIPVSTNDISKVAEIIVSIIDRYYAKKKPQEVALSWKKPEVQLAVANSIANLGTLALVAQPIITPTTSKAELRDGHTPLTMAITNGDYAASYALVQSRSEGIDAQTQTGDTCLHIALRNINQPNSAYRDIALWLVRAGANLDLPNNRGMTPRNLARGLNIHIEGLDTSRLIENADDATVKEGPCSWISETCRIC